MPIEFLSAIDDASAVAYDPANSGLDGVDVQSAIDSLSLIVATGGNASAQGTWLVSGGGVAWSSGYTFNIAPAQYYIMGVAHTSPAASRTLAAPDATFNRFDIIAATAAGTVVVLQGTPSAAPELPDVDPNQYLALTIVRVDTGTTSPPAVVSATIYAENLGTPGEWTGATSGSGITLGSTNNPHAGTKDVEFTAVAAGSHVEFTAAAPLDITAKASLAFYVRSKALWAKTKSVVITFRSGTAVVGSQVALADGFFGFDSSNTAAYQLIAIPISQFALPAGTTADRIRFAVSGGGASIGFHFDDCSLQGGTGGTGTAGITQAQADARYAQRAANLSDLTSAPTARTNLGLGSAATFASTAFAAASHTHSAADITSGTLAVARGGTGTGTYTTGDLLYADAANSLARLGGNVTATRLFLRSVGSGTLSAAPAWDSLQAADVPALDAAKVTTGTLDLARLPDGGRTRPYTFGAAGTITTGQKPQALRVEAAGTAYQLDVTASAGTLTAQVEQSTNGGSSWSTVDSLALASGLSATKSVNVALTAGTLLRVNYTAQSGASDPVVTLYVRKT